jgi:hypothetical protein
VEGRVLVQTRTVSMSNYGLVNAMACVTSVGRARQLGVCTQLKHAIALTKLIYPEGTALHLACILS